MGQQSDDKQPIKLTHAIVNINKATSLDEDQTSELGGGRVIEEQYNLKHSNNLRLKKWSSYKGGWSWRFDYILIILFII